LITSDPRGTRLLNWKSNGNDLVIGEKTVAALARRFGTPLYLYDSNIILDRIKRIQIGFPGFRLLYSIKSNPNIAIASLMAKSGLGAEIASEGELKVAKRAGFSAQEIAVAGPGKRQEDLKAYINAGVGMVHLESQRELELINGIAEKSKTNLPIVVRVNAAYALQDVHERMGGVSSQFGIPEEDVVNIMISNRSKYIDYIGFHSYGGSQVLNQSVLLQHFKYVANMSKRIAAEVDFDLQLINFGGGFGIPYHTGQQPIDIKILGKEIVAALGEIFPSGTNKPTFYIELGRYLVAESTLFVVEILDVKACRGTTFVITDGGINNFARPAMPWATQHSCVLVSKLSNSPTGKYKVVGPLCQPSDVLCERVELADPQPGDFLAIFNAGAYGYTLSPQLYHSKPTPREVLYQDGDFHIIRERLEP